MWKYSDSAATWKRRINTIMLACLCGCGGVLGGFEVGFHGAENIRDPEGALGPGGIIGADALAVIGGPSVWLQIVGYTVVAGTFAGGGLLFTLLAVEHYASRRDKRAAAAA